MSEQMDTGKIITQICNKCYDKEMRPYLDDPAKGRLNLGNKATIAMVDEKECPVCQNVTEDAGPCASGHVYQWDTGGLSEWLSPPKGLRCLCGLTCNGESEITINA